MRVLMLTHNMAWYGGSFMRVFPLARELAQMGYGVTVLAGRTSPGGLRIVETRGSVRVIQQPDPLPERMRHGGLSPFDLIGRAARALSEQYDLVHCFNHRPAAAIPALLARSRWRVPLVYDWADLWGRGGIADMRGPLSRQTLGWLDGQGERRLAHLADAVTVISSDLGAYARAAGVPAERIHPLPVGADVENIRLLPKAATRVKYQLPPDAPIVVHIGFAPYDADLLAGTFVSLARMYPAVILLTAGRLPPQVVAALERAGLRHHLRELGAVPYESLGEVLACGDVMILPYSNTSINRHRYPNRLGDYLAAGRPVVTNRTGDAGDLVSRERVGLVVEEDPEQFAGAIRALLEQPAQCEEMGRRARALAEGPLSWRAMAARLDAIYHGLVDQERGRR
ncbi:MAG: glycosyltransferase family 4 protein [Anaerolineae bacterium]